MSREHSVFVLVTQRLLKGQDRVWGEITPSKIIWHENLNWSVGLFFFPLITGWLRFPLSCKYNKVWHWWASQVGVRAALKGNHQAFTPTWSNMWTGFWRKLKQRESIPRCHLTPWKAKQIISWNEFWFNWKRHCPKITLYRSQYWDSNKWKGLDICKDIQKENKL